jgi:hypothetical protein
MMATLVIVVTVTPVGFAVPIAIDSVTVFVAIGPMIVSPRGDDAARDAHQSSEGTHYN